VEGLGHCPLLRSARWRPRAALALRLARATPLLMPVCVVRRLTAIPAWATPTPLMLRTLGLPLKRVGGNSR
jgi:hypothetical protein